MWHTVHTDKQSQKKDVICSGRGLSGEQYNKKIRSKKMLAYEVFFSFYMIDSRHQSNEFELSFFFLLLLSSEPQKRLLII